MNFAVSRLTVMFSFLTNCSCFLFSTFLPHPPTTRMLFRFGFVAAGASLVLVSQVLASFDVAAKYFSVVARIPRLFVSCVLVQQRFLFCIPGTAARGVPFVVFKRDGEGGCRRKGKGRCLSFSSTRQLSGAPPSLERLIHRSYFGSIYLATRYCFVLSFNLPQQQ